MDILNIDHIGTRVADVERSINFYQKFGFKVSRKDFKERVFVVKHASGVELNFLNNVSAGISKENILMDTKYKPTGYTHIALAINSIKVAVEFLKQQHITITQGPVTFGDGKTSVFIRDPDRNVIEFTELPKQENK